MRVLIIQPWISYRGAESVSLDEAHGLAKLGHEAAILCLFVDRKRLRACDLSIHYISPFQPIAVLCQRSRFFLVLFGFWILLFLLLRKGKDFAVYNPHNFPSHWVASLVGFVYSKPVFWTVHNFPQHGFSQAVLGEIWEILSLPIDRLFISGIYGIVCVSEKVKQQIYERYKRLAVVLYPPIDSDFFGRDLVRIQKKQQILIPAKLHKTKNQFLILQSIRRFVQQNNNFHFLFAGDGDILFELCEFTEKYNISQFVTFLGFVSKESLRKLYAESFFTFLPGRDGEGFNIGVLESLCAGTPCVVFRGSGVDTWVQRYKVGFVVNSDEDSITKTFLDLVNKREELVQIGRRGQKLVADYSSEHYAKELFKQFKIIL